MKSIVIFSDISIDDYYEQIKAGLDARFHNYRLSDGCERMSHGLTEAQKGEIETMTAYAAHASGDHNSSDLYVNGVHIERLIR